MQHYNSTLLSFTMSCFHFPQRHMHYFLRGIREIRQSDFVWATLLQFLSEYFRDFKTFQCLSQECLFSSEITKTSLVCMISLSLCSIDLLIFQSKIPVILSMGGIWLNLYLLTLPLLTFGLAHFSCLYSYQNLEFLYMLIWIKNFKYQDYAKIIGNTICVIFLLEGILFIYLKLELKLQNYKQYLYYICKTFHVLEDVLSFT